MNELQRHLNKLYESMRNGGNGNFDFKPHELPIDENVWGGVRLPPVGIEER